ncbi:PREDICTED: uncharacterized protein LOC109585852 [Amphimedon queenslandica]|uniref:Death domain-containing protein n=1 Tax=Amphimedon queenslandica TaxID=400682 RepID=A0AAN0JKK5_AMPQE|nr:PREDICTED: uncharacterized protein LOC109585852 [Amphimedon queenslandica]|eukprot:XP_019857556.1 PREDICTED: uncharacterized protein LOC109585852 [Amphimedon queenslandica]
MASKLATASKLAPGSSSAKNQLKIIDLAEVLQLLKRHGYSGDRFFDLGLYLGLSPATLNVITLNHKGDIETCLRECLTKWLKKADNVQKTKGGPTIYSLVSALRELGENRVADGIDMEKHPACRILAHHTTNRSLVTALPQLATVLYLDKVIKKEMQTVKRTLLIQLREAVCIDNLKLEAFAVILCRNNSTAKIGNAIIKEYKEVYSSDEIIKAKNNNGLPTIYIPLSVTSEFKMMRLKLADTFFEVGSSMMNNPNCTINYLKYVLRQYNKALRPQLDQCEDVHDILELVCDSCPLDDISVLEHFVNKFNIEEAKRVIEEYKEAVEEFREKKLSECLKEQFSRASPLKCEEITIVIDEDADDFTLKDVKRLSLAVFENLSQHVKLNVIIEGSITITCSFPLILSEQLITVAQGNIAILRANQVKRLTIGYCTVYEVHEIGFRSDEQQFPLSLSTDSGLLKQLMVSLTVQLINSEEKVSYEESMTLEREAESLIQKLDAKIKILGDRRAESDEFKDEFEEFKEMKEILEEQLVVPAFKVKNFFEDITEKLPNIAKAFNNSVTDTKELVSEATEGLKVIRKHKKVREVYQVKESYRSLSKATEAVHTYLDKVNGLYQLLSEQTPDVMEDIESGELKSTEKFAAEIEEILKNSSYDYEILRDCFKEFATNCDNAQIELTRLKKQAQFIQATAAAGGLAAGGIAASLLVGVFTAGIGAAVGVPLTLAATAGTATGVAIALKFHITAATFRKMNERLEKLRQIERMQYLLNEIHLTNKQIKKMTPDECKNLAETMRSILKESIRLYNEISRGLEIAEGIKVAFSSEVDSTFFSI